MADKKQQTGKKRKKPDTRPARARYWVSGRLRKRKIARLVKHNGFATTAAASVHWHKVRKRYAG